MDEATQAVSRQSVCGSIYRCRPTLWQLGDGILFSLANRLLYRLLELGEALCEAAGCAREVNPLDAVGQIARQALQVGREVPGMGDDNVCVSGGRSSAPPSPAAMRFAEGLTSRTWLTLLWGGDDVLMRLNPAVYTVVFAVAAGLSSARARPVAVAVAVAVAFRGILSPFHAAPVPRPSTIDSQPAESRRECRRRSRTTIASRAAQYWPSTAIHAHLAASHRIASQRTATAARDVMSSATSPLRTFARRLASRRGTIRTYIQQRPHLETSLQLLAWTPVAFFVTQHIASFVAIEGKCVESWSRGRLEARSPVVHSSLTLDAVRSSTPLPRSSLLLARRPCLPACDSRSMQVRPAAPHTPLPSTSASTC